MLTCSNSFVASEAGNQAAQAFGMPEAPVSVQQSVEFITAEVRFFRLHPLALFLQSQSEALLIRVFVLDR
jgi:hypothetical protein